MNITVTETVTYTDKVQTRVLFSGLSTYYTIDTWLAKGIGFVKGSVNGNSLSPSLRWGGYGFERRFQRILHFPPGDVRIDSQFAGFIQSVFPGRWHTAQRQHGLQ